MSRSYDQENLQRRLHEWKNTEIPTHREERIQDAVNRAQAEYDHSDHRDGKRYLSGVGHTALPSSLPWLIRWRGRLIGGGIMGGLAGLLIVAALTWPHGNNVDRFGSESSVASSSVAQKSADSAASASGSSSSGSSSSRTEAAQGSQPASQEHAAKASGTAASRQIPDGITKVEVKLIHSRKNGVSSSAVHREITESGTIETLRNEINGLQHTASAKTGCSGNVGNTATLTFVTDTGKQIPVKVDGNCGTVAVKGVKLDDSQIWMQLISIVSQHK